MGRCENNIIPIKISHLAAYVSKVKRISLDDALVYIYVNPMYERLYNEEAKWWYLSTEALYEAVARSSESGDSQRGVRVLHLLFGELRYPQADKRYACMGEI